jgi:DNA-binding MarR family transcriptional regulator
VNSDRKPEGEKPDDVWLDPATSAGYMVRDTHLAFGKALRERLRQYGMTTGQYYFLRALWIEEGLSQRELSRRVGTTEPTTASALRLLEKKGLVSRLRNRDDRRTINIFLTGQGRELKNQLLPMAMEVNRAATAGLDDAEMERAYAVLRRLRGNLAGDDGG